MCGIIGIISNSNVVNELISGLKRLEYRGYDSSGISCIDSKGAIQTSKAKGKISELENIVKKSPISGNIGIGHTRWATHGLPSTNNAHPHSTEQVSVIHNGIIENFSELKSELLELGYSFKSDTDSEVIPLFITHFLKNNSPIKAVEETLKKLTGAFAIGVIFANDQKLIVARNGSPLAIGYGKGEMYIASDAYALAPYTSKLTYLEDGDYAEVEKEKVQIYDKDGNKVEREIRSSNLSGALVGKGNYRHFMQKEIFEQPDVLSRTLNRYYNPNKGITLPEFSFDLKSISEINIVACGTSYYAANVAKYWLEDIAKIPTHIDIASEFRYSNRVLPENGVTILISQSGETADTLAALKFAKSKGQKIISIVNAEESSMEQISDEVLRTLAGPEIGVASTKAFTTQLMTLACFAIHIAHIRNEITNDEMLRYAQSLSRIPSRVVGILNHDEELKKLSKDLVDAKDILYIGRGTSFPIAMEGALKIKELSYIHAEGIAAGELKHGPIALIDENVPVIVIAPFDELFTKTASNVQEVAARGGRVILLSDKDGIEEVKNISFETIEMPKVNKIATPILYSIPVQIIAYHTAVFKGTDVDQPRNLAKSVTVE